MTAAPNSTPSIAPEQGDPQQFRPAPRLVRGIGLFIFMSRWIQMPLYVGLILAQCVYVVLFVKELVHLVSDFSSMDEAEIMLLVLGLIDVVMIANLLIMVIIGGYETFVAKIGVDGHPDQPEWLSHVNANVLKIKLAMAIIGISSIHLLKSFIEIGGVGGTEYHGELTSEGVKWQVIIHSVFILSAIALAWIDRMSHGRQVATA